MALQGFDKTYYLNSKIAALIAAGETEWMGQTAEQLEAVMLNVYNLTPEDHYAQYGYAEGLAPNAYFNADEYKAAKAHDLWSKGLYLTEEDALAAFETAWSGDAYQHYLQYGAAEGINPSNSFDESSYYESKLTSLQAADPDNWNDKTTEDVEAAFEAAGLTALGHYIAYGQAEGIEVTPVPASEIPGYVERTYALTAGAETVDEGGVATFALTTENVAEGTEVAYTISGVDAADVTGDLTGTAVVGADGTATIEVALAADAATEGEETLTVTLDGTTANASVAVADTSYGALFGLTAGTASVDEGAAATFALTTENVAEGTEVAYTISGVDAADVAGGLTGTAVVGADGTATIAVTLAEDAVTEGEETLTVTLDGKEIAASVAVADTSLDPVYALTAGAASVDEGAAATFALTKGEANFEYAYSITGVDADDVDGDLTGTATTDADGNATITVNLLADRATEGAETLTVTIPNTGLSATTTVNDTSLDNIAPVAEDAAASTDEGAVEAITGQLTATDAEGDALTFALVQAVEGLTLNADGSWSFDPSANTAAQALASNSDPLVINAAYTATDDQGGASEAKTLAITVTPTPLSYELTTDATSVQEGDTQVFTLTASEPVPADTTVTFTLLPGDGTAGATGTNTTNTADFATGAFNPKPVTIAAGETTATFEVVPTNDATTELPETFTVQAEIGDQTLTADGSVVDATTEGGVGQTFNLTTGIDTIPGLVGSANSAGTDGDDHVIALVDYATAANTTLNSLDQIDAGLGNDTMTLNFVAGGTPATDSLDAIPVGVTVTNGEILNLRAAGNIGDITDDDVATADAVAIFDVSTLTGLSNLNVTLGQEINVQAANTTDIAISGAAAGIAVEGGQNVTVTDTAANNIINVGQNTVNNGTITVTDTNQGAAGAGMRIDGGTDVTVAAAGRAAGTIDVGQFSAAADLPSGEVNITADGAAYVGTSGAVALGAIAVTGGSSVSVTQTAGTTGDEATAVIAGDVVTQGAVTVTAGDTTTSVTVVQDDQVATNAAAVGITGVQAVNTVTFTAISAGDTVTVDGLIFTAAKALTATEVAAAFSNLTRADRQDDGGSVANGVYTGATSANWTSGDANGAVVTFTAAGTGPTPALLTASSSAAPVSANIVAGVAGAGSSTGRYGVANGAVTIDDNATASITTVTVDGYGAGATIGAGAGASLNALTDLTLRNSGAGGNAVLTSTSTTLNVTLDDVDGVVNLGASATTVNVTTENATSNGTILAAGATSVTIDAGARLNMAGGSNINAATAITINGAGAVSLAGIANNATLTAINAGNNSGGVTVALGNTNNVAFTGGTGSDNLTLANAAIASAINMGAGNDTLSIAAGTTAGTVAAAVDGGEGTDTVSMGFADAVGVSASALFDNAVTGFERLTINNSADDANIAANTTYTVNLANLSYDYVTVSGTGDVATPAGVDTLALTGMAADGTVAVNAQGLYTVALADATGTADELNYVLRGGVNAGTVTANAVETFNIASSGGNTIAANGDAVTSMVITGGSTTLTTAATTLTAIDGSGMNGGLTFTDVLANGNTLTVTGGTGSDTLVAAGSGDTLLGGFGGDTLTGADLTTLTGGDGADTFFMNVASNVNSYSTITDAATGDTIDLDAGNTGTVVFAAAGVTLAATAVFQDYANAAVNSLAGFADYAAWFQYEGDTYIVQSGNVSPNDADFENGTDSIIQLTGLVDLSAASYNQTIGTLEIA